MTFIGLDQDPDPVLYVFYSDVVGQDRLYRCCFMVFNYTGIVISLTMISPRVTGFYPVTFLLLLLTLPSFVYFVKI